jgi:UDP-glucuronate 4-epimerase
MRILVTGAAGFIGAALSHRLLDRGDEVVGVDNLSPYYDVRLKEQRLERLRAREGFHFRRVDLSDAGETAALIRSERPARIAHLAAQPGVRHSIEHPEDYVSANLVAFVNIIEGARRNGVDHFLYASSSSVYGANRRVPFSENDPADHPLSLYGATKRADELMAHSYSHLYGLPCTGLRYFTVYGPWGRPDMAPMLFTEAILAGRPLSLFAGGEPRRDFTYIDDAVEATVRILDRPPAAPADGAPSSPATGAGPHRIYNVGSDRPVRMTEFVDLLEHHLGRKAIRVPEPAQPGDVDATWCDTSALVRDFGYKPGTPLEEGIAALVRWYREYRQVS